MIYEEHKGDLFRLSKDTYIFAHCIATDMKWGAGIAPRMFQEFSCGDSWRTPGNYKVGDIGVDPSGLVMLFTKESTFGKPTYESIRACLISLKEYLLRTQAYHLAIPRIGCGLDKLSWPRVREILIEIFQETPIEIQVYVKENY